MPSASSNLKSGRPSTIDARLPEWLNACREKAAANTPYLVSFFRGLEDGASVEDEAGDLGANHHATRVANDDEIAAFAIKRDRAVAPDTCMAHRPNLSLEGRVLRLHPRKWRGGVVCVLVAIADALGLSSPTQECCAPACSASNPTKWCAPRLLDSRCCVAPAPAWLTSQLDWPSATVAVRENLRLGRCHDVDAVGELAGGGLLVRGDAGVDINRRWNAGRECLRHWGAVAAAAPNRRAVGCSK